MPAAKNLFYFSNTAEDNDKARPPLILIHGAGGNHLSWPPQIRHLDGAVVYAIDLPGHGKSEGAGRQSIDEYVDTVLLFMRVLKIRTAIIAGISMGGAIALRLALKHPDKVAGLVLFGAGAKLRVAPVILETIGNINSFESAVNMVNEHCFSIRAPENLIQLSKRSLLAVRPAVLLGDFLACSTFDVTEQLDKINVPVSIVCGAEDRMAPPKISESLRDGIINSKLHILENAGHMVMLEKPDEVVNILKNFLEAFQPAIKHATKKRIKPNGEVDSV